MTDSPLGDPYYIRDTEFYGGEVRPSPRPPARELADMLEGIQLVARGA